MIYSMQIKPILRLSTIAQYQINHFPQTYRLFILYEAIWNFAYGVYMNFTGRQAHSNKVWVMESISKRMTVRNQLFSPGPDNTP